VLIIECKRPNTAEVELIKSLDGLDGIAVIGYTVTQGDREREIDALVFTPVRAVSIEVKAPIIDGPRTGELTPNANSPWTINGERAEFYGGSNPMGQARTAAQIFARFLKDNLDKSPFVQVAIAVTDAELTMSDGPLLVGQTAVSLTSQIIPSLDLMKKRPIKFETLMNILHVMKLGELIPPVEEIENEWRDFDKIEQKYVKDNKNNRSIAKQDQVDTETNISSVESKISLTDKTPTNPNSRKNKFFSTLDEFSKIFNNVIVVFLFLWFFYSVGGLNFLIIFFDTLQSWVSGLL